MAVNNDNCGYVLVPGCWWPGQQEEILVGQRPGMAQQCCQELLSDVGRPHTAGESVDGILSAIRAMLAVVRRFYSKAGQAAAEWQDVVE